MASEKPERDVLFDHAYDGIMEYDNPMPGWWVWLFVGSIVFSGLYALYYHVGVGPSIYDKLEAERAAYGQQLIERYGQLEADEQTIATMMQEENVMNSMASLFKGKCAQCHAADGSGGVGPNLTDDYYINVNNLTDIARILTNGVEGKGMPAWEGQFSETQIVLMSAYVAYLRETDPGAGKQAEGEEIPEWPEPNPSEAEEG
jgi:cytochrome c oxidase cbb3-type subunit 3